MLRYLVPLLAIIAMPRLAGANDLERLYRLALVRDATLQAAIEARDAAIEARPQALAAFLPQLSANASAMRERADFANTPLAGGQAVDCRLSADAGTQRCYGTSRGLGVSLSQTMWSFQAFSQLKEADSQAAAAEAAFTGEQQNLLLRVAKAYFGILSASDQLDTNRRERDAFATLLEQAKVRERTGLGPRSDVEQAQAFYDATLQSVIDAENALDDANLSMTEIVGRRSDGVAPLREDIPLKAPQPANIDAWVDSARRDNPGVRAAELKADAASHDIAAQRGRALPTFMLTLSSSKLSQDQVLGGNQALDTVGVSFRWPLFQGGAVASAVRQSRALYRRAQAELDFAQRDTERQTRAAFRGVESGVRRIEAAHRAVESSRDAVEAGRRNVEFGTGTEFDLLNAQTNYYTAIRAYDQARYDYLTSVLTLKQQAGRLSERDVAAVDALLVAPQS